MIQAGKVAIVTGGTSGIGAACAEKLLSEGYNVTIVGRDRIKAEAVVARLRGTGPISATVGDVSNSSTAQDVIAGVLESRGRVDALVNSAGIMHHGRAEDTTDDAWHESLAANVSGTFFMCRAAIPAMRTSGGGAIVNIASDWGLVGGAGHVAYCATKGAVVNMTRALALDHAGERIRINVLCPGEVRTPMLAEGLRHAGVPADEAIAALGRTIPIGRVSEPFEQASAVAFLLSDAASFITGAVLSADGGSTTR